MRRQEFQNKQILLPQKTIPDYSPKSKVNRYMKQDSLNQYIRIINNSKSEIFPKIKQKDIHIIQLSLKNIKKISRSNQNTKQQQKQSGQLRKSNSNKIFQNNGYRLRQKWAQLNKNIQKKQLSLNFPQINNFKQSLIIQGPSIQLKYKSNSSLDKHKQKQQSSQLKICKKKDKNKINIFQPKNKGKLFPSVQFTSPTQKQQKKILFEQGKYDLISRWTIKGFN